MATANKTSPLVRGDVEWGYGSDDSDAANKQIDEVKADQRIFFGAIVIIFLLFLANQHPV